MVDLKETTDIYGRLMILAKWTRNFDHKGAIGNHEFTLKPRSLFSPDGSMLRCTDKSKLIRLLQMLGKEAKLEQGSLPSEETGCVYECSMDEDATYDLPTDSLPMFLTSSWNRHIMPTTLARKCIKTMLLNASTGTVAFWPN